MTCRGDCIYIDPVQLIALINSVGITEENSVETAFAVAAAESGLAVNNVCDGCSPLAPTEHSVGLWQINIDPKLRRPYTEEQLVDPAFNAQVMAQMSGGGVHWSGTWSTYPVQSSLHMADAILAYQQWLAAGSPAYSGVTPGGGPSPTPAPVPGGFTGGQPSPTGQPAPPDQYLFTLNVSELGRRFFQAGTKVLVTTILGIMIVIGIILIAVRPGQKVLTSEPVKDIAGAGKLLAI